jgi:hypothetical protein
LHPDPLAIASAFITEKLAAERSIVGAVVAGSVARGEATPASDLDVRLIVAGSGADELAGTNWHEWRDGVFVDVGYEPLAKYSDTDAALADPYFAGSVRDAVLLHDPDGVLAAAQAAVREQFAEPRWLATRLAPLAEPIERNARNLQVAAAEHDHVTVARTATFALWTICDGLLVMELRSPCWLHGLQRVGAVRPADCDRIAALEGTEDLTPERAAAFPAIFRRVADPEPGTLMDFVVRGTEWMIGNGLHREAVQALWAAFALTVCGPADPDDPAARALAESTAREWLALLGWSDPELPARAEAVATYAAEIVRTTTA